MKTLLIFLLLSSQAFAFDTPKSAVSVAVATGGGSGTVVSSNGGVSHILTCKHIIDKDQTCFVIKNGNTYRAKFIKAHKYLDLSLLEVNDILPTAVIATSEVEQGMSVRHFGRATGPQKGFVLPSVTYIVNGENVISSVSDFLIVPGDSGAGVFNNKGEFVGVIHSRQGFPQEFGNANYVRLSDVKEFLK